MAAQENSPTPAPNAGEARSDSQCDTQAANYADAAQWQAALETAQTICAATRPSAKELATLASACTTPRHLHTLLEAFARHSAALPANAAASQYPYALLCDFVDDSAHDLRQWINALVLFEDWLRTHNYPPQPLTMLLPYLACSAEAQANSPMSLPLPHILADMLELYGYEGS